MQGSAYDKCRQRRRNVGSTIGLISQKIGISWAALSIPLSKTKGVVNLGTVHAIGPKPGNRLHTHSIDNLTLVFYLK